MPKKASLRFVIKLLGGWEVAGSMGQWLKDCKLEKIDECCEFVISIQDNIVICYLKLWEWNMAIEVDKKVIMPSNGKAYYRVRQASIVS
ncbi:hypothetical protein BJV82DRAFT_668672 [Fennellomyces sp. T-0311]|nr:hypothetical protein BJV82DRAFT_668672 [Fennellomyces sp. T-0311]